MLSFESSQAFPASAELEYFQMSSPKNWEDTDLYGCGKSYSSFSDSGCSMDSSSSSSGGSFTNTPNFLQDSGKSYIQGNDVVFSTCNVSSTMATPLISRRSSEVATSHFLNQVRQEQMMDSGPEWNSSGGRIQEFVDDSGLEENQLEFSDDEEDIFDFTIVNFSNEDFEVLDSKKTTQTLPAIGTMWNKEVKVESNVASTSQTTNHQQSQQSTFCVEPVKKEEFDDDFYPITVRESHRKLPILSQFLVEALENPDDYSHMIKWINREKGIFEFSSKNKEEFAKSWGVAKNNRCQMTYQKMSRALRIYIKKEKVLRKERRKLQYVFRPEFLRIELERRRGATH